MVSSILTNNGAMTALQSLKATQKNLLETQNRISTGLKVSTAKDNAATWAVATSMRSDIANYKQVSENLSVSSSILSTAEAAATTIADLVKEIRTKVSSAANPAVDKAQVQADIDELLAQIDSTAQSAAFKGVNLVNSDAGQRVLTSVNQVGGNATAVFSNIAAKNLTIAEGSELSSLKDLTVLSRADQTFSALNDGVSKTTVTLASALDINAGNTLTFKYVDETNTSRDLQVKFTKDVGTVEELVEYLNGDATFSGKLRADRVTGDLTTMTLSAKDRDSAIRLGAVDNAGTLGTADLVTYAAASGSGGTDPLGDPTSTRAGGVRRLDVTFADGPLQMEDEFVLKVQTAVADEDKIVTYKLKVVGGDYKTGQKIDEGSQTTAEPKTYVIALAAADVMAPNVSGKQIAEYIQKALFLGTGANASGAIDGDLEWNTDHFLNTADAGNAFDVAVSDSGMLSVLTASGATDNVLSFNSSKTDFQVLMDKIADASTAIENAAASFGTAGNRIDMQKEFLDKLVDTLTTGLGAMVDADMSEEAARLQALQVQEQLGTQALSIANQAPQSILSLFR
ncbi:flagellin [Pseudoroseomonas rhizosphaerae]|uniref:Flagellin n=1 Tax=Teichococcus rhizosphaerae TaxID=1335062 RepID=A0A2C7A0U7_9PROT|nr:flagellin [Pseudoroseomonas rhizosphaerae]PHK93678.1 flagellin [Pseudoroseomonas rhizosphaerae]